MIRRWLTWCAFGLVGFGPPATRAADPLAFRGQVIDPEVGKVCYAVATTDVDGDGKPDIVAVANDAVVWYQNPTWQKRDIVRGATEPDNVCLQPHDVDGDGRVDFALGSAWRPADTRTGGNLAIVTRTGAPEGAWRVVPIAAEPTLHRVRWGDIDGTGKPQLIVAPLQGRDTRGPAWSHGAGVRILALSIPDRPFDQPWPSRVIDDRLHTVHNLQIVDAHALVPALRAQASVLVASWEGVLLLDHAGHLGGSPLKIGAGRPASPVHPADPADPARPVQGVSEVKLGHLRDGSAFVATIEPWHGSQFVVYHGATDPGAIERTRHLIATGISWGHAVWCVDLDGDGDDEVVVGQRDPNPAADPALRGPGVLIFDPQPGANPIAFTRTALDPGGVAVEDLVATDLDGDGRAEIVAGGRATHNVKIYWNETQPRP